MTMPASEEDLPAVEDLAAAVEGAKAAIRRDALDPAPRLLLFQLLCVAGDWQAASNQIAAYRNLLPESAEFARMLEGLIAAEIARERVFSGTETPPILGGPSAWVAAMAGALAPLARGDGPAAAALRDEALEQAPAVPGNIDGAAFSWLNDGDGRLGPVLEIMVARVYYWVPPERIRRLRFHPPEQTRDLVWAVAQLELTTGATLAAHLPARYAGAAQWENDSSRWGRRTDWAALGDGQFTGQGQKVWMTEVSEHPILETRLLEFFAPANLPP